MDVSAYIASGILELYVLGKLTPEEEAAVKANAAQYPDIAAELEQIELDLEQFDRLNRVEPPQGTLGDVLSRIRSSGPSGSTAASTTAAGSGWKWLSWAAFGLAALLAVYFYFQASEQTARLQQSTEELEQLRADCAEKEALNNSLEAQLAAFQTNDAQLIALAGSDLSPASTARVLYSPVEQRSFLTAADLPPPPTGKQYQLWALVDGNPVDMGVFELNSLDNALVEVPYVDGVGAFAITLEDAGGRPTPNLDQLYLIGNVG